MNKNKTKTKTKRISKTDAVTIITNKTKGRFFTIKFTTNDGRERTINGNYKHSKKLNLGYLSVYSAKDMGYRTVNTRGLLELTFKKVIYKIK